jgi:hypothetical protein
MANMKKSKKLFLCLLSLLMNVSGATYAVDQDNQHHILKMSSNFVQIEFTNEKDIFKLPADICVKSMDIDIKLDHESLKDTKKNSFVYKVSHKHKIIADIKITLHQQQTFQQFQKQHKKDLEQNSDIHEQTIYHINNDAPIILSKRFYTSSGSHVFTTMAATQIDKNTNYVITFEVSKNAAATEENRLHMLDHEYASRSNLKHSSHNKQPSNDLEGVYIDTLLFLIAVTHQMNGTLKSPPPKIHL